MAATSPAHATQALEMKVEAPAHDASPFMPWTIPSTKSAACGDVSSNTAWLWSRDEELTGTMTMTMAMTPGLTNPELHLIPEG